MARIAWGITGSGDKIEEVLDAMVRLKTVLGVRIDVFVSKAGRQVLHWYRLWDRLNAAFDKVKPEVDANVPFIAGPLQVGKYDVFVVAPLTANSAAKIAYGIEDTLITNAVAQALKGTTPVLLYPVDQEPGEFETVTPEGVRIRIKTRAIDIENVERLRHMEGVTVLGSVSEMEDWINGMFRVA
ncbi:MAG: archaeoflavoprotein AfpA [Candidatus Thorarchaeota archaeon]|nr:MAG: archaeoflavoprotein AfpA [Candidatus Thorarchaeota archaeon]